MTDKILGQSAPVPSADQPFLDTLRETYQPGRKVETDAGGAHTAREGLAS
jgi:hypothetical protein